MTGGDFISSIKHAGCHQRLIQKKHSSYTIPIHRQMTKSRAALTLTILAVLLWSCTDTSTNPASQALYVSAKIGGTDFRIQGLHTPTGTVATYQALGYKLDSVNYIGYNAQRFSSIDVVGGKITELTNKPVFQISFTKHFPTRPYTLDNDLLVNVGPNTYGNYAKLADGVEVEYRDAAGKTWKSTNGTGDQTGSTFIISRHESIAYLPGQATYGHYLSQGTFNCTLYDSLGTAVTLSNGEFSIRTIHYVP